MKKTNYDALIFSIYQQYICVGGTENGAPKVGGCASGSGW